MIFGTIRLLVAGLVLAAMLSPPLAEARDRLVIGITQFPSTLNPLIDSMLAKSYVLGMAQRPVAVVAHDWEPVCVLCTEHATFENGRAERIEIGWSNRGADPVHLA